MEKPTHTDCHCRQLARSTERSTAREEGRRRSEVGGDVVRQLDRRRTGEAIETSGRRYEELSCTRVRNGGWRPRGLCALTDRVVLTFHIPLPVSPSLGSSQTFLRRRSRNQRHARARVNGQTGRLRDKQASK